MANSDVSDHAPSDGTGYASPVLNRIPGAYDSPEGEARNGVAWHYGDPLVEQRAFERGAGLVDRSHFRVLSVIGADALTWLNSLISQKIDALEDGSTADSLILDVNGRVLHAFTIIRADAAASPTAATDSSVPALFLVSEPERFEDLLTYLTQMVFWANVKVQEEQLALVTLIGPEVSQIVEELGHCEASQELSQVESDNDLSHADPIVFPAPWPAPGGLNLLVPRSELEATFVQLITSGAQPTGLMAFEAARMESGHPLVARDLDDRTVPHEVPAFLSSNAGEATQLHAANPAPTKSYVHLNKGCYRGQETVSRIQNLGKPPRQLVILHIDGSASQRPRCGDPITQAGTSRVVGRLGTVVDHCDYGPIALGIIKRTILEKGVASSTFPPLEANGVAIAIDESSVVTDDNPKAGRIAVENLRRNK